LTVLALEAFYCGVLYLVLVYYLFVAAYQCFDLFRTAHAFLTVTGGFLGRVWITVGFDDIWLTFAHDYEFLTVYCLVFASCVLADSNYVHVW